MTSPANPGVAGNSETTHDGMSDAGHREQFGHANGGRSDSEDRTAENKEAKSESEKDN